eukprot:TRINITY_DN5058_c0_g2_i1.p1 TRINITY_DN5058_c0_g2~~TRINITY_DN5058_c0_g2_i1.p1  ORF type:complete len:333 (+),score=64.37 TRINITY_DN5058_c0_g2_i1:68-1066(+)
MKIAITILGLTLFCAVAAAQKVDTNSPCRAFPELGVDLSTLKGQGPMGPYNFTSNNIFGPSSIYIDMCGGNNGVLVSGTGGPARLNGPLVSTANNTGAYLDKGYMVFTYRNPNIYRRHCGPAGVSFQIEFRCDQTTSQREEFSSSEHSFCNLMVTVWTASACPALPPTTPEDHAPFTDVWQPKSICRAFERGIDLSSLYGLSSPVYFKWNTVPGTVYPCGNPRTGSLLDIVSAKHGMVTMAKLDGLIAKNQTEDGLSFLFRGSDNPSFCMRRGKPMVQVVFQCPQPDDDGQQGGNDSTLEDDGDWSIKVSDLWGERCFVRVKVSTKLACPQQ